MDRSQLRELARKHARGELDEDEYLRRRIELIDAITAGTIPIERAPPRPAPPPAAPAGPEPAPPRIGRLPYSPLHLVVGIAVVVAVVWFIVPASTPPVETTATPVPTPPPAAPARPAIPPARELMNRFLDRADWSAASIEPFIDAWAALPEPERAEALSSPWFRRLITALRQEINAQQALASLDRSGDAAEIGLRLAAFGRRLGIERELPEFRLPEPSPPVAAARRRPPRTTTPARPAATPDSPAPAPRAGAPAGERGGTGTEDPEGGNRWLVEHSDDGYTLQLFAVGGLDRVKQLVAAYPDLALHVLTYTDRSPRYRIVYGQFQSPAEARAAYAALPSDLTRGRAKPLIRLIKDLRAVPPAGGAAPARRRGPPTWLSRQPGDFFTLQLFASDQPDNVRRLVDRFPALDLKIHRSGDTSSRFRVLHGVFPSAAAARAAAAALPPRILQEAGKPLVRSIAELQAIPGATSD